MEKASARQLNFGTVLRNLSMERFAAESQVDLRADQAHFDRKYSGPVGCPFLAAQNKVRSWFGIEPIVRRDRSLFAQATDAKDERYEKYKRLLNSNDQKFYHELAKLRYPESKPKLGITEEDRAIFDKSLKNKTDFNRALNFVGRIVTRNIENLFNGLQNEANSDKNFVKENDLSLEDVANLVAELVGGFRNGISNQLEYFRIGAGKLIKVSEDIQSDLKQLLKNNIRILQSSSFLQIGQFRKLLNYFDVRALNFTDKYSLKYVTQRLNLHDFFEIRSISAERRSPVLVPKEEFVDRLVADFEVSDHFMDGRGTSSLTTIAAQGKTRGCLANELTFPESVKAEFKDLDSYKLKKNVLLEIAHYLNEVITELVIPKINMPKT